MSVASAAQTKLFIKHISFVFIGIATPGHLTIIPFALIENQTSPPQPLA